MTSEPARPRRTWLDPPNVFPSPEETAVPAIREGRSVYDESSLVATARALAEALALHPAVALALSKRGFTGISAAQAFLDPDYYQPVPPEELPGVAIAAARLERAIAEQRPILVWGDFDVDGQTSTALLTGVLRTLGAAVRCHIPLRATEGHGVGVSMLKTQLGSGTARPPLVLTCDTGITAFDAAEYCREAGIDLIITDHHELALTPDFLVDTAKPTLDPGREELKLQEGNDGPSHRLPPAIAVVTPRLLPDGHPLATLSGVGVAYKLMEALCQQLGRPELSQAQRDLTALGLVADVAELTGEARYLVQTGLRQMRRGERLGLRVVYENARISPEEITEESIGFLIAPRMNALGRLGDANPAVELLTGENPTRLQVIALQMEALNARRQMLTSQILRAALAKIEADRRLLDAPALVLAGTGWEAGVIGIVAARLVEIYGRPTALIALDKDGIGRGSARSAGGVDLARAIAAVGDVLLGHGGHRMAAGFTLQPEQVEAFRRKFVRAVGDQLDKMRVANIEPGSNLLIPEDQAPVGKMAPRPARTVVITQQSGRLIAGDGEARLGSDPVAPDFPPLQLDAWVSWSEVGFELAAALECLAPFGNGNPPPTLATANLRLLNISTGGRNQEHLTLTFASGSSDRGDGPDGEMRRVTWWGGADIVDAGAVDLGRQHYDLAYTLRRISARGVQRLQLELVDLRPAAIETEQPEGPQVVDLRTAAYPAKQLRDWIASASAQGDQDWLVWAEGEAREKLLSVLQHIQATHQPGQADEISAGSDIYSSLGDRIRPRHLLAACQTLVIWTAPPSRSVLQTAIGRTRARQVVLFGVAPEIETPQAFLEQLAGLAKHVMAAEGGNVEVERLAAALAQRLAAVRYGLDWLAARGYLTVQELPADPGLENTSGRVTITPGGRADADVAALALEHIRFLLDETRAYRTHFRNNLLLQEIE